MDLNTFNPQHANHHPVGSGYSWIIKEKLNMLSPKMSREKYVSDGTRGGNGSDPGPDHDKRTRIRGELQIGSRYVFAFPSSFFPLIFWISTEKVCIILRGILPMRLSSSFPESNTIVDSCLPYKISLNMPIRTIWR